MANIVVDIGNTALKAAWAEGMTLGKTFRYQGERTVEFILSLTARQKPDILAISSVRQLSERDIQRLETECGRLVLIDSAHPDIVRAHGFPAYISPDRAAGLIAARYLFKIFIRRVDFRIEILYRSGQIARYYFTHFVILRIKHNLLYVERAAEKLVAYKSQSVCYHRHLLAVLHNVFFAHRAH